MTRERVMLITGARKGIGRGLAEHYLAHGYTVAGCSREASDLVHPDYLHITADVADEASVVAMFQTIRKQCGRLDVLLNNAGIASMNHALLTPAATVERILSTNVTGTMTSCREAAKLMRRDKSGRIVNFTTVAVPLRLAGEAAYAASKAAVESLTRVLAYELADHGITVNAVGPSPLRTDLTRAVPAEAMERLIGRQAIQRWGELRDVANAVDFFIRPESDFITGQVLYLGGIS